MGYKDVWPLIGETPFSKTEEELISDYNSMVTTPQLLFLGLDEKGTQGFEWTVYKGSPFFALDVTPKGSFEAKANSLIRDFEARGLIFIEGRLHMSLPPPRLLFTLRHAPFLIGMLGTHTVPHAASLRFPFKPV